MQHRRPVRPVAEVLSEPDAARLLARASELDAANRGGAAVADLRAAAAEAGISTGSFDAALGELEAAEQARVPDVSGRRQRARRWAFGAAVAALIAVGTLAVLEMRAPGDAATPGGVPIVEEAVLLNCLSPAEAAEVIRPILDEQTTIVVSPDRAPRVITIRATPAQMERVRSVLDRYEGAGSTACATNTAGTP
jgi:hypothetical protein